MRGMRPDRLWFLVACAGSIALLLTTFARAFLAASGSPFAHPLRVVDLRVENNLAAWWSGMLLLMVALHAFDGFVAKRRREPRGARGWLLVAVIALIFSIDELASVHERVSIFGTALGIGIWPALAPFGLILLVMLGAALIDLRAGRLEARRFRLLAIGFLVILTVPVQEFVEHRWTWPTPMAVALRAVIEEGSELLGILLLLRAAIPNSMLAAGPAFEAVWRLRTPAALAALMLTPVLAIVSIVLTDTFRGVPASWLGAALLLLAALALVSPGRPFARDRLRQYAAGALAVIGSAAVVQLDAGSQSEIAGTLVNRRLLVLVVCALLIAAVTFQRSSSRDRLAASLAVLVAASACVLPLGSFALHMTSGIVPLALYWTSSGFDASVPADEERAVLQPPGLARTRHG